ncbi:MAG: tetratricopeptide repeat protein [Bacillota bacterium]
MNMAEMEMDSLLMQGRRFLAQNELSRAEACLTRALEIFHQREQTLGTLSLAASASLMRGIICEHRKQWEKAYFHIKQSTKLAPGRADCWLYMAYISFHLSHLGHTHLWEQGCRHLRKVLQLDETLRPAVRRLEIKYGIRKEAV